ncbi:hypothetical protein [Actinoplanes sp. HUAS TT8]|uniref:hypothetical protein n=1 Tax=Actinoplanes sp. HUAS TT8 TaxID=3447453 RepID=UPI003F51ED3B
MIRQSELIAVLNAIAVDAEVQVRLDGIPLEIIGVRFDEFRGLITLALDDDQSRERIRRFVGALTDDKTESEDGRPEHAVRRNSRGHFELLRSSE